MKYICVCGKIVDDPYLASGVLYFCCKKCYREWKCRKEDFDSFRNFDAGGHIPS